MHDPSPCFKCLMQHTQDAFRVGSANLSMAYGMQSIDARIQFGIEIQMQLA